MSILSRVTVVWKCVPSGTWWHTWWRNSWSAISKTSENATWVLKIMVPGFAHPFRTPFSTHRPVPYSIPCLPFCGSVFYPPIPFRFRFRVLPTHWKVTCKFSTVTSTVNLYIAKVKELWPVYTDAHVRVHLICSVNRQSKYKVIWISFFTRFEFSKHVRAHFRNENSMFMFMIMFGKIRSRIEKGKPVRAHLICSVNRQSKYTYTWI